MLRIDETSGRLVYLADSSLGVEGLFERRDVQEMIVRSWDDFAAELGFPTLRYLDQEVRPHEAVANRIDILAFDEELGVPVIIELKRDSHRLHLLQALHYAAMVWTWVPEDFRSIAGPQADEDLLNSLDNVDRESSPRLILIAEAFDPEVILTADWLRRQHGVDVHCYRLSTQRNELERFIRLQRDYPLRELTDVYQPRRRRVATEGRSDGQTWDDVKQWVLNSWQQRFIDYCRRFKEGDPRRRRFSSMFADEWGPYSIGLRRDGARIYIRGRRDGDMAYWEKALPNVEISEWGNEDTGRVGLTFRIDTAKDASDFLSAVGHSSGADELEK